MCTICNDTAGLCARHRSTASHDAWLRRYPEAGDDVRELRERLRDGLVDFAGFEMVS